MPAAPMNPDLPHPELAAPASGPGFPWTGAQVAAISVYFLLVLAAAATALVLWHRAQGTAPLLTRRAAQLLRRAVPGEVLGILLFVLFTLFTVAGAVVSLLERESEVSPAAMLTIQSVVFHWGILLSLAVLLGRRGITWRRAFGIHRGRLGRAVRAGAVGYLVMLPVVFLYMVLYQAMLRSLGFDTGLQDVAEILTDEAAWPVRLYMVFIGVGLAPLAEELLFRGVCFPVLARRIGPFASMMAVSTVFALVHFHVPSALPLFVVSVILCLAYVYTRSIVVPTVMHMLFNAVNLLFLAVLR